MTLVESLQQAINFIEEHLLEPITIEEIAQQANVSSYHFQRSFMMLTDLSVGEYIRRRRLTLAAQELISENHKVMDVAFRFGYDTPESFAKAFRKQHGITPSEARKGMGTLQSYNRLMIQVKLKGVEPMNYRIVERESFKIVGEKRTFSCGGYEAGIPGVPEFWVEAHMKGLVNELIPLINGEIKGLLGITNNFNEEKNTIDYWVAAEYNGDHASDELLSFVYPASKWVVFEVKGSIPSAMINAWQRIYSEWFPSNGYQPAQLAPIEAYLDSNLDSENSTNEIWVAIK
jgi:AraC family transcriptional regulator